MKPPQTWKAVAAASAMVVLATACAETGESSNGDDDASDGNGLPASDMRDWDDVTCDMFLIDDFQEFVGFEEWSTGPMENGHGSGGNPSGLTCEGSILWPEFVAPHGRTLQEDATFGYELFPQDSREEAEEMYDMLVDFRLEREPESEATISGSIEGDWVDSYYSVTDGNHSDSYYIALLEEDFAIEFGIHLPHNPTDRYDEEDLVPGEWEGFDFDQDSAAEFFFEEQMPNIHDNFMNLLERKE